MTEDKRYGYKPAHNKLGEQDQTPLNRTYTIGSASRTAAVLRERSRSQDRNTLNQTFTSFPRHFLPNGSLLRCKPQGQNLTRMLSNQLPSLEGCSPERICTQRPWTRTQIELAKYKETLKG
ncbi:unnamed protein product [Bursaphelenchus xylophilus]|uniref:(pine wood nematode) hypothetical protein n=1 Tax=Bursaphelenchus xylophilus TaxID=6326 RepID=A0A1I7RRR4_BURXY|nr:unnamed protein product [Bursaphelenchus xylophilus]CAG9123526.1 unnamed protein product [Bursaphelenchus xylophilus]